MIVVRTGVQLVLMFAGKIVMIVARIIVVLQVFVLTV